MKYTVKVDVEQTVTRQVEMLIEADTAMLAREYATEMFEDKPFEETIKKVSKMVTNKQKFWAPRNITFKTVQRKT